MKKFLLLMSISLLTFAFSPPPDRSPHLEKAKKEASVSMADGIFSLQAAPLPVVAEAPALAADQLSAELAYDYTSLGKVSDKGLIWAALNDERRPPAASAYNRLNTIPLRE